MAIESFIQFGALGIVAYVVVILLKVTNKLIENNTKALTEFNIQSKIVLSGGKYGRK